MGNRVLCSMESDRSLRHCFCNICKGHTRLSSFKVKQHVKLYGLWVLKDSHSDTTATKKAKVVVDSSDHSSDSDSDQESAADDNMCIAEDHSANDNDGNYLEELASGSGSPKVHFKFKKWMG